MGPSLFMKTTKIIKDVAGQQLVFRTSDDVGDMLASNKREQNEPAKDLSMRRKVASVPTVILDAWIQEGIDYRQIQKDPAMRKKFFARLNDPEFKFFKTHPGHIG